MDIGLGLTQILSMSKNRKKPHPNKPIEDPVTPDPTPIPEPEPIPTPEPTPTPTPEPTPTPTPEPTPTPTPEPTPTEPTPTPEPTPVPTPAPEAVIPGVLDASRIVVLGPSLTQAAFGAAGSSEPSPQIAAYAAEAGFTGKLRFYRDDGKDIAQSRQILETAQADVAATQGKNLYLLQSGTELVSTVRPISSGNSTLANSYRDLVSAAASKGDKVVPVPLTKVLYGRGTPGYPNNSTDVVDGNPATDANGTQPYNREIVYPALRDHAPGWAPEYFTSDELAARLSLKVDRPSVVTGEAVYLSISGLTDEEAATWGFQWEFDTSGEFRYLADLPWHMRQKNRATGHHQVAAWDISGTKAVKVCVLPPAWSGQKGTLLSVQVENRDPNAEFAGNTAVLDTSSEFEMAPSGTRFTAWDKAYAFIKSKNGGRILLKRGDIYPVTTSSNGDISRSFAAGVMFDAWGDEKAPLPVLDIRSTGFNWRRPEAAPFHLIKDVEFKGGYDGVTGDNAQSHTAIDVAAANPVTINGCKLSHMQEGINVINPGLSNNMLAIYDCHINAWENYGIYTADLEKVLIRGSYICQDPTFPVGYEDKWLGGPKNQADHGPIRLTKAENMNVVVSQMRMFSCNGWSGGSPAADGSGVQTKAHQPILRLGALNSENVNALVTEVYSEGGGYALGGGNAGYTVGSGLIVFKANYMVHTANWNGIGFGTTGCWCLDNIIVVPKSPAETQNDASWIVFKEVGCEKVTATWANKSINIANNTIAFMASHSDRVRKTATFNDIVVPATSHTHAKMPKINIHDNVFWAPNIVLNGDEQSRIPNKVYSAGLFGPKPLYRGWHYEDSVGMLHFDPKYATPVDSSILPLLPQESNLCGTADRVFTSALDFFGRPRGIAPTVGAVERNLSDVLDPIIDPYALADAYPELLGPDGQAGYGFSLGRYMLARVAAGALGAKRDASRAGRSVLYNVGKGHPDEMGIGPVNRIRSLTDYTGFPMLCGAKFRDGGFDPFVEVNVEPQFDTGVTYDGLFAHLRIGDPRLLLDAAINTGIVLSGTKTYRLHFGGLTPGDQVTVSCVGITTAAGARRGDLLLEAGQQTVTGVLNAASDAASNMAVLAPVKVPANGRISLSITPQKDATNAYLSSVLLDFG